MAERKCKRVTQTKRKGGFDVKKAAAEQAKIDASKNTDQKKVAEKSNAND